MFQRTVFHEGYEAVKTKKVEPVFESEDGTLFRKVAQTEALRDPNAIREIVPSEVAGEKATVRWLLPLGTRFDSDAEKARVAKISEGAAPPMFNQATGNKAETGKQAK
jgi:hypothetical protein